MNTLCPHCHRELQTDREKYINCCYVCRRFALLLGRWPLEKEEVKDKNNGSN